MHPCAWQSRTATLSLCKRSVLVFLRAPFQLPFSHRDRSDKSEFFRLPHRFACAIAVITLKLVCRIGYVFPDPSLTFSPLSPTVYTGGFGRLRLRGFPTDTVSVVYPPFRWVKHRSPFRRLQSLVTQLPNYASLEVLVLFKDVGKSLLTGFTTPPRERAVLVSSKRVLASTTKGQLR